MPIYEYTCDDCGHNLEALQKFSDDPLKFCPECNEATLKKQISAAAFHLKGTGWYETDFKNNGKKPDANKVKESKTDKKPDTAKTKSETTSKSSDTASSGSSNSTSSTSSNSSSGG